MHVSQIARCQGPLHGWNLSTIFWEKSYVMICLFTYGHVLLMAGTCRLFFGRKVT